MLVVGYSGYIRTSTDGGATWTDRQPAAAPAFNYIMGCDIGGVGGEMIACGFTGYVRTSTDGGATWTDRKTAAGSPSGTLNKPAIGLSGELIIGGYSGYLRTSTDGGAS